MLRFSKNPSSCMNIGDLRLAIFNYIVSKQLNEDLLIRIDDIDTKNNIESNSKEILELLSLFSIDYKSTVYQSENLKYHQKIAMQLMMNKKAFSCFCSDEKINELKKLAKKSKKPYVYDGFCGTLSEETAFNCNAAFTVRLRKPEDDINLSDLIKGDSKIKASNFDFSIILNHDKNPLSSYACAIDDMLYNISTVIRDEKYEENTAEQIHIRNYLSYDKEIQYLHLAPVLKASSTKKESFRDDTSIQSLIKEGFLPSAIANYVVSLGNKTPLEIFTLEEAISWFDIKNISKNAVKFDLDKLKLINKKHLEDLDELRLSKLLGFADADIGKLAKLYLEESSTIRQLKAKIDAIFAAKVAKETSKDEFEAIFACLKKAAFISDFKEFKSHIKKETSLSEEDLEKSLKYVLTGNENGPDLEKIYPLIKNYLGEIIK